MKRIIRNDQVIPLDRFPYKWEDIHNNPELLRPFLFVPLDPNLTDDSHCIVLDYDGFVEWFPEWNAMYRDDNQYTPDWYKDSEGERYLIDHVNRTVDVIKGVTE